jgi:NADH:ubiquinone oxidoreductase subunit K
VWYENDPHDFIFTVGYLVLNIVFVGLGIWGVFKQRPVVLCLLLIFVFVRTAFLAAYESCEPRYTLELYPVVLALGAQAFATRV